MTDLFAHTRRGDPDTSHAAADAVTPDLRALQVRVAEYAKNAGPEGFTDAEMEEAMGDAGSTYRTRRSELASRYIILDSGRRRTHGDSPRQRVVWVHRDYVEDAPTVSEPILPATPQDKAAAKAMAAELAQFSVSMQKEGRAAFAAKLAEAANLMRRLII